jgi:uncharacterized protein YjbJ (UPF0337 family)
MGIPNKDEVKGKGKQAVGGAKEKTGEWTKDPDLENEGRAERDEGRLQESYGERRRKADDKMKETGERIGR